MQENIAKSYEITYKEPNYYFSVLKGLDNIVFFDSVTQHENLGRYSFIAIDPDYVISAKDGVIKKNDNLFEYESIWDALRRQPKVKYRKDMPPFQGGFAGFFSYDLARQLEKIPNLSCDDLEHDDLAVGYYNLLLSFDNKLKKAWIISTGYRDSIGFDERYANERIQWLLNYMQSNKHDTNNSILPVVVTNLTSNFTEKEYSVAVDRAKEYILSGDIFEVNIAQRFSGSLISGSSYDLYQKLRSANAAPFCAFSNIGNTSILSTSPERFLKLNQRNIETRPIKGTIARCSSQEDDVKNANQLINSAKDRAENVMIVDLMRNDLSKVSTLHSVKVQKLCGLESFRNVHHLVSVITAELSSNNDAISLLKSCFPGGSITGAPKIRAMEIIDEIEGVRRGPYCGSIGYISDNGCMDISILIRTVVQKGQSITLHSGGAITLDSNATIEYAESLTKAATLISTLTSNESLTT